MTLTVRRYRPADLPALVAAAAAVGRADVPYPPPEAGTDAATLAAWLTGQEPPHARWVAVADGAAVGHVQVTAAHGYLTTHLAAGGHDPVDVELGRLFVDPAAHGTGAGRALLQAALTWARTRGLRCGLAVIDGSSAAEKLYRRAGLVRVGSFVGVHGLNHVYVDGPVPHPPGRP